MSSAEAEVFYLFDISLSIPSYPNPAVLFIPYVKLISDLRRVFQVFQTLDECNPIEPSVLNSKKMLVPCLMALQKNNSRLKLNEIRLETRLISLLNTPNLVHKRSKNFVYRLIFTRYSKLVLLVWFGCRQQHGVLQIIFLHTILGSH